MTIVKLQLAGNSSPVWYILELQGKLEFNGTNLDGEVLGDIIPKTVSGRITSSGSTSAVTLHIGASKVNGVIEKLQKPVIVITKEDDKDDMIMNLGNEKENGEKIQVAKQKVVAIIRSKIVFRERPQPIIGGLKIHAAATKAAEAERESLSNHSSIVMQQ
jgi:hypothetical protein